MSGFKLEISGDLEEVSETLSNFLKFLSYGDTTTVSIRLEGATKVSK